MWSANLLLIGPDGAAREYLMPLMSSLASPVAGIDGADPAFPSAPLGTLILWNVERLTPVRQTQLLEWLSATQPSPRIIALSADSLFTRVQHGTFSEHLYYRLNTITILLPPRKQFAQVISRAASQLRSAG
jgi:transcriptional regulator of acetoin/glycerol metabolism